MRMVVRQWALILLCFSLSAAIGGGLYESVILNPLWSKSPPSSFSIIQPGTGVVLQRFWIPVHVAITLFFILALVTTWRDPMVRPLLLVALLSYVVMRAWSGLFFIPEMLAFQKVPLETVPTTELLERVSRWRFWTWFREPLDIISFACSLLGLHRLKS